MKKVVIIGAGPAGLFAAYKLAGKCQVTILDKGLPVEKRRCPSPENCNRKCALCAKLYGEGGAGTFSDGKVIFSTEIGSVLNEVEGVGIKKNQELVKEVQDIFGLYGVHANPFTKYLQRKVKKLEERCTKAGMRFIHTNLAHVGTDRLVELITSFRDDLKSKGVEFVSRADVSGIKKLDSGQFAVQTETASYPCDKMMIAPGRVGAKWLEDIVKDTGMEFTYNPMDIGVRVEVKRSITDRITALTRDMKFIIETPTYKDYVRTFCTCPGGKVARETHDEGYNLVNGHSEKGDPYENTNFAFLVTIPFTKPMANGNEYARQIAREIRELGGDKPLLQRLGDLRGGHRSKKEHAPSYVVKPSLEDVTFGDIGLALPYRIVTDIIEGLQKLNRIMPGVNNDDTLLYAPEAKFHALRIKNSDAYLQTSVKGIYVAGDGAGLSRGIVGAAACGVLAAEGMLKD